MNVFDVLILALIGFAVFLALRSSHKSTDRCRENTRCSGDCQNCAYAKQEPTDNK